MFQRRKDKGSCANIKFGCANTAAGHQRATKLQMQNDDDDKKDKYKYKYNTKTKTKNGQH